MKKYGLLLLALILLPGLCLAYDDVYIEELTTKAHGGDVDAMHELGVRYHMGEIVELDYEQARQWFEMAYQNGNKRAAGALGRMYYQGAGVERDYAKAYELMSVAAEERRILKNIMNYLFYEGQPVTLFDEIKAKAEAGDAAAQYRMGQFYHGSFEVMEDMAQSEEWMLKSAEGGYLDAQIYLSMFYSGLFGCNEENGCKDDAKAFYWFTKAEEGLAAVKYKDPEVLSWLGLVYADGDGLVEPDFDKARQYLVEAAEINGEHYYAILADIYYRGDNTAQDYAEALHWYLKAADAGNMHAMRKISDMYKNGQGVEQNDALAWQWHRKFAWASLSMAQRELGGFYLYGKIAGSYYGDSARGAARWRDLNTGEPGMEVMEILAVLEEQRLPVEKDLKTGIKWYKLAALNGDVGSQELLGHVYDIDAEYYGVEPDLDEAVKWLSMGAENNNVMSLYRLGQMYLKGRGVKQDYVKAYVLTAKAAVYGRLWLEYDVFTYVLENVLSKLMTPGELNAARGILSKEGFEPDRYLP